MIKKIFKKAHLILGLVSGLFVTILCVTGTILVFAEEISKFVDSDIYTLEVSDEDRERGALSIDLLINLVEVENSVNFSDIHIPKSSDTPYTIGVRVPGSHKSTKYLINQYSGELLGTADSKTGKFFSQVMYLHRWLLLDSRDLGKQIVGATAIILIILSITGVVLWFPKNIKNLYKRLRPKLNGTRARLNYDIHTIFGSYIALFIIFLALTGIFFTYEGYRDFVAKNLSEEIYQQRQARMSKMRGPKGGRAEGREGRAAGAEGREGRAAGAEGREGRAAGAEGREGRAAGAEGREGRDRPNRPNSETNNSGENSILKTEFIATPLKSLEPYIAIAEQQIPYGGDLKLQLAGSDIQISCYQTGFWALSIPDVVSINMENGEVSSVNRYMDNDLGARIVLAIKPLHMGEMFGLGSKIIYFIICLITTLLPFTGFVIWFRRRSKKRKRKIRSI